MRKGGGCELAATGLWTASYGDYCNHLRLVSRSAGCAAAMSAQFATASAAAAACVGFVTSARVSHSRGCGSMGIGFCHAGLLFRYLWLLQEYHALQAASSGAAQQRGGRPVLLLRVARGVGANRQPARQEHTVVEFEVMRLG